MEMLTKQLILREFCLFFSMLLLLNASPKDVGSMSIGSNIKMCNFFHKVTIIQSQVLQMVEIVLSQKELNLA